MIDIFCPSIQCSIRKEDNENACIFVFISRLNYLAFFMHFSCTFHTFQTLVKVTRLISSDAYRILCNIYDIFFHILSHTLRRFLNMPQVLFSALLRFDVSKILWKSTHFRVILSLIFLLNILDYTVSIWILLLYESNVLFFIWHAIMTDIE